MLQTLDEQWDTLVSGLLDADPRDPGTRKCWKPILNLVHSHRDALANKVGENLVAEAGCFLFYHTRRPKDSTYRWVLPAVKCTRPETEVDVVVLDVQSTRLAINLVEVSKSPSTAKAAFDRRSG